MATSYTRQSSFSDGDTITAALFNNEFNQLLTAFSYASSGTTGHRHDGTAGEGGNIHTIGDQDFLNKILTTSNTWEFYVEVSSAAAKQMVLQDGALVPHADSDLDLGTSSKYFKDAYIDSITTTGNVAVGGNLTVTGTTTFNGGTLTLGDAADDNVVFGADVNSNIIPNTDNSYDLGSSTQEWKDLYVDGTAYLDAINFNGTAISATAAEINILDGVTATASELNIMDGVTATTAELNILDGVTATAAEINILDGVTATATELNLLDGVTATTAELNILDGVTSTAAELNTLDGVTAVVGELNYLDLGSTAVGTAIASKAVVLDSNKDYTGIRNLTITGELDAATLDISGNVDIDGTLEADAITVNGTTLAETISDTIGAMVTSNTESGITVTYDDSDNTLDFTVGTLNQDTTGSAATVTTAAQPNITSLGTLTTLTVDNVIINGTTIGHTSDTDLITLTSGVVTVAGELDATSLDISGDADIDGTLEADAITIGGVTLAETIADTVGAMVSSNTETNITVTYEDSDNTLDFVIGTLNQDTTGTADNFTVTANNSADETVYPVFVDGATGSQGAETDTGLTYNPSSGLLTISGELDAGSLDISGDADIDGTLETDALSLNGTAVTSTAAELNILDAVSRGSLIYGNSSGATALLTKGGANTILTSDGTDISWAAPAASGVTYVTKTANYTASDLEGVLANTSGGAFTVTLPASPSSGAQIIVADSGDAFGTNNLTVARNGETIDGTAADFVLDITGVSVQFVYNGSTWRVYAQVGGKGGTAVNTTATQTLTNKTLTSAVLNTGVSGTAVLDEDNMASDSATKLATQQSIKAYVDSQVDSTEFVLEDDDGTEVTVSNAKEVKFIGSGITTNWTDTDNGTDGDPYDLTFTVDAAQTGITSLLATDIKIGEDDQTKIDFETADEIHFYANNVEQVYLGDNIFGPQSDSDVDLGSSSVRWKDAYVDSITVTGEVDAASLDVSGNVDIDGTLEADGITSEGSAVKVVGKETIWVPAVAMYPNTTNGCAAIAQVELSNGPELKCLDFATGADDFAQFTVAFPKSWNEGTVTFQPFWTVTGTNTGTVAWGLAGGSMANDASINTAFGTAVVTTAKAHSGTSNDMMVSDESGAITIANAAADTVTFFEIHRDVSADDQSGDARLLGIKLFFTTDAKNDA